MVGIKCERIQAAKRPIAQFSVFALALVDPASGLCHLVDMKQDEIRKLVRNSHQNPFRVHLSDGTSYTLSHPDFGAVAENALIVLSGPGHDLGNANFIVCYFDQITRVEQLKSKAQAAQV